MTSSASTTVSSKTSKFQCSALRHYLTVTDIFTFATAGSSTSPAASATTTPPDSAGSTRYSSIALVVGAVAAIAFFN